MRTIARGGLNSDVAKARTLQLAANNNIHRLARIAAGYEGLTISGLLRQSLSDFLESSSNTPEHIRAELLAALAALGRPRSSTGEG
ncbi:hypothetical protein CPCC7001_1903 [Cyanobium sp. PCC 7001]|nr:hypothetical protein CPCC7001_1903 [Cyanobium sp. PCC 7001]